MTNSPRPERAGMGLLLAFTLSLGCSSTYMPRPSSQLSIVMDGGRLAYVRGGQKYEGGFFGGDIEEAVHGVRQAEDYASEYKTGMIVGFVLSLFAVAGAVGGTVLTGAELGSQPPNSQATPVPGLLVIAGAAVLDVVSLAVLLNAQPHLFDAINAYNDGVAGRTAPDSPTGPTR